MNRWKSVLAATVLAVSTSFALAAAPTKPVLTLEAAKGVVAAAEKSAMANHWAMTIAILDDGGNLIMLEHMDGANLASITIAQQKAKTSAMFMAPSKVFGDGLASTPALQKLDILPFEGGIPLMIDGKQVGAIGVSGGDTADKDGKVAQAGVDWLKSNGGK